MANDSRFSKYRRDDLPPLVKLDVGEQFTGRLTGEHEYSPSSDDEPKPVLEFEDEHRKPFAWRASAWRAIDELDKVDPQPGDWVTVIRLPDRGRSHDFSVHVGAKGAGTDELAF
jgi:hypothetical protein